MDHIILGSCEFAEDTRQAVKIEMWYDRHLGLWTLYPVDENGYQLSYGATYANTTAEALEIKKQLTEEWGI